jgi:hypothetical protein
MNVEIGAGAALFPEKEYISGIFVAVCIAGCALSRVFHHIQSEIIYSIINETVTCIWNR